MRDMDAGDWERLRAERTREIDALAARDNVYRRDDPNARRLKDLSPAERDAVESEVTALIKRLMSKPHGVITLRQDGIK